MPDYSRDHQGVLMLLEAAEYLERNSDSPTTRETTQRHHRNGVNDVQNRSLLFCPDDTELEVEEAMLNEEIAKAVKGLRSKRAMVNEQTGVIGDGQKRKAKAVQGIGRRRART